MREEKEERSEERREEGMRGEGTGERRAESAE